MTLKEKLYIIFEDPSRSKLGLFFNGLIYFLIIASIVNLMLISVSSYNEKYGDIFQLIRNIIMPIFIFEYILRLYASGFLSRYRGIKGKIKYILTPYAIIDFLAILPYFLVTFGVSDSFIRSLRLLRVFRLFRARKYIVFMRLIKRIIGNIKEELIVLVFFTFIVIVILSFIMYDVEHEAQPEAFSDIFTTMWWSVATLTTIGYGDLYPITPLGRILTSFIAIIGIGFVAIPGGMFASEFMNEIMKKKKKKLNLKIHLISV